MTEEVTWGDAMSEKVPGEVPMTREVTWEDDPSDQRTQTVFSL